MGNKQKLKITKQTEIEDNNVKNMLWIKNVFHAKMKGLGKTKDFILINQC